MARQRQMLLAALVLLRNSLRDLDSVVPTLRKLGERHAAYGAEPAHYPVVGQVLIGAMAEVAGDDWEMRYSGRGAWRSASSRARCSTARREAELPLAA